MYSVFIVKADYAYLQTVRNKQKRKNIEESQVSSMCVKALLEAKTMKLVDFKIVTENSFVPVKFNCR